MRKTLWTIPLLLLISAIGAPRAHADGFTYTFVGASILSGTNFTIVDAAGPAIFGVNLVPFLASPADIFVFGTDEGPITLIMFPNPFQILLLPPLAEPLFTVPFNPTVPGVYSTTAGTLTVIDNTLATPEPSSVALMLLGLGLVLLRKRNSRGHQLAT